MTSGVTLEYVVGPNNVSCFISYLNFGMKPELDIFDIDCTFYLQFHSKLCMQTATFR